jgi:hypothetical protein
MVDTAQVIVKKDMSLTIKYSTRIVIILNDIVIKIPISRRGYLQSLNEKKVWDKYNKLNLLAELKWFRAGIVCQKKYDLVKSIPDRVVYYTKKEIPEFRFYNCDLHNHKNWGREYGKYILLDYGINEYIASLY